QGPHGQNGEKGDTGAHGPQGEKGEKGDTGAQGGQGEKGEKGDTGAQGAQGEKGEKGDTGAQGAQGEKGEKGDTGAQGPQGEKGEDGKDANANITDNGDGTHTITINNPDGTTSTSVVKDGKDGVDGKSATATVTPGEDGKSSIITVTNPDGTTTTSVVKDGAKGDKGDKGEDGKDAKANIADNGDGTHTITINNPDGTTSTSVVKDGAKGDKGDKGEDGKDAKANIADNGDGTHTITINNPDGTTSTSVVKDGINGKDGTEENVVAGNSITVTSKDRPNTGKEFEVSLNDKVTVGQKENGSLVVKNAGDDTQITIENGTITIKTADGNNAVIALDKGTTTVDEKDGGKPVERMTYTSKDASGKETKRELATMDDGLVFAGDSGKDSNRKLGSKVTVSGGQKDASKLSNKPNIGVVSDGKGTLSVKLAKDIDLTSEGSVTVGGTTVKNDGVRIAKGPSLTTNGIDAGGKKITNVAPGRIAADSKDAVNGSQLHAVKNDINNVNNKVDKLDKRVRGIGASAAASSSLPQVYSAGRSMVAAAAGNYSGASAVAVGYSRASDNGKLILKLQGTANSEGHFSSGVGVGYQW
ncbi:MAG: YadA-like family protein, partial [[Actinobacillus] rossii]|nr:YadA-like family protein [[Actinobacillus] rossii]